MKIKFQKRILVIWFSIIIYLLLLFQARMHSPVFLWNRTPSVPLGVYRKLFRVPNNYGQSTVGTVLYVAIDAKVLLQEFPTLSQQKRNFLAMHGRWLSRKNIVLLKELSLADAKYVALHSTFPHTVTVVSQNPQGIDSRYLGPIPKEYVRGLYRFVGR